MRSRFIGKPVGLKDMLHARDVRVLRQQKMLAQYKQPIVCLTLNIAGPVKYFPMAERTFEVGCAAVEACLNARCVQVSDNKSYIEDTGCEAFFSVDAPAEEIKRMMVKIEDRCEFNRLFDIDVLRPNGTKVQRSDVGHQPRKCFLCDSPAEQCARSRTHTVEQLQQFTKKTMISYFSEMFSENISRHALRALLYEVSITPKPGLVDRTNNGAHKDMDFFTFIDSSCSLIPYFKTCAKMGLRYFNSDDQDLFELLRPEGVLAEKRMLTATGGVNTHKGAIFSLGLICAAAGRIAARGNMLNVESLCCDVQKLARCALKDYERTRTSIELTGGEKAFFLYGLTGVRGEAASGFIHARKIGLPKLQKQLEQGSTINDAGVVALLHLMSSTQDTNVVKRRGIEALKKMHHSVESLLNEGEPNMEDVVRLDRRLSELNISPGGCADLLAITFFLCFITTDPNLKI